MMDRIDQEQSCVHKDFLAVHKFLGNHTSNAQHSQSAVLKFLVRHFVKFISVRWLQVKRIKSNITWEVFVVQVLEYTVVSTWCLPSDEGTVKLKGTNDQTNNFKECWRYSPHFV